jgi:hypothetical protein
MSGSGGVSACAFEQADCHLSMHVQATCLVPQPFLEIRTCKNVLESKLDVAGVQGRRLDERKVVLACVA